MVAATNTAHPGTQAARPPRPTVRIKPNPAGIPGELKERAQWVCWRYEWREGKPGGKPGAWAKVLCNTRGGAHASVDEPASWAPFAAAWQSYQRGRFDGIGFVFSADDPYCGADFDKCRNPETGELTPAAQVKIDSLATYAEISPSGEGVHCILRAVLPHASDKQTGKRRDGVELYDRGRYFTFTGKQLGGTPPTIEECQAEAEGLYAQLAGGKGKPERKQQPARQAPVGGMLASDADVIAALQAERNGKFARLWAGDTSGYRSLSEARAALVQKLRFRVGDDAGRIEGILRGWCLADGKLDDPRGDQSFAAYDVARILAHMPLAAYYGDGRADDVPEETPETEDMPEAEATPPADNAEMDPPANLAGGVAGDNIVFAFALLYRAYETARRSEAVAWAKVRELQERDAARQQIMRLPNEQAKPAHKLMAVAALDMYREAERTGKLDDQGGVECLQAWMEDRTGIPERSQKRHHERNEALSLYRVYSKPDDNGHDRTYIAPLPALQTGKGFTPAEPIKHGGNQKPCPICGKVQEWLKTITYQGAECGHTWEEKGVANESEADRKERQRGQLRKRHARPRPPHVHAVPDPDLSSSEDAPEPPANLAGGPAERAPQNNTSVVNTIRPQNDRRPPAVSIPLSIPFPAPPETPDTLEELAADAIPLTPSPEKSPAMLPIGNPPCPDCGGPTYRQSALGWLICRREARRVDRVESEAS